MKPEVQAKFLQHLNRKNQDGGFTLIELLVVIIIIGILAAIALPSFLNQANKGKQSEAKQYCGALGRGQQAYYLEKTSFTTDLDILGVGIKTQTENYYYQVEETANVGVSNECTPNTSKAATLKSYGNYVVLQQSTQTSETTALSLLVESNSPNAGVLGAPADTVPTIPAAWQTVK